MDYVFDFAEQEQIEEEGQEIKLGFKGEDGIGNGAVDNGAVGNGTVVNVVVVVGVAFVDVTLALSFIET